MPRPAGGHPTVPVFNLEKILLTLQSLVSIMRYDNLEEKTKGFSFLTNCPLLSQHGTFGLSCQEPRCSG